MARDAMMGIATGQHRAPERRAEGKTGNGMVEVDSRAREDVYVGRMNIGISVAADRERTKLVAQNPDHVRSGVSRWTFRRWIRSGRNLLKKSSGSSGSKRIAKKISSIHEGPLFT